nr:unnamed protein product [Spirometra erinaceieuropaei]
MIDTPDKIIRVKEARREEPRRNRPQYASSPAEEWGREAQTEDWKYLWPLPACQRRSCRFRRANRRRLEKLTNEGADGRLEVPVAVTGRSKRELSIEESQTPAIGEANQRRRRRKTGSACGCYRPDDWRS